MLLLAVTQLGCNGVLLAISVGLHGILQKPKFSEIVEVRLGDGTIRKGQVLEVDGTRAVVQVRRPDLHA